MHDLNDTMHAVAAHRGESVPRVIDVPRPILDDGDVLVRTLRVGIDGTDHHVIDGGHGGFPDESPHMILGHEAVGVVEASNDPEITAGTFVVPTVRRPVTETASNAADAVDHTELDMAPDGSYVERGIVGAHGYMSEYFTSPAEYLVEVPKSVAPSGFLIEPISNTEKALDHAFASRAAFSWDPESALVLGNGPLGLITLAMLGERFERTYCLGRRDRPDPTIDIIERLGGTYIDSRETPIDAIATEYEPMDLVYEATGHAKHAFGTVDALAPNGVGVLLGIPDDWSFEIDGGRLHRDLVLENKALIGSVNSSVPHFEAAKESLAAFPEWFVDALITGVHSLEEVDRAFENERTDIKTVVEFADVEQFV